MACATIHFRSRSLQKASSMRDTPEFVRICGKSSHGGPEDPFAIVEGIDHGRIPALRIDCGAEDGLIEQNRAVPNHLEKLQVPHEYQEDPGAHDWAYWDLHVQEAIGFHARNLKIENARTT
jgi:S-formylglutathione hydrolase FrmB